MTQETIAFIGGGNMARSLIGGLIADGYDRHRLRVADPSPEARDALQRGFGVEAVEDNATAADGAGVVVLAVKPQALRPVAEALGPALASAAPLVVSIAAGVRTADLARWLGHGPAIVRAMPNTPALVQSGATALFATAGVSAAQRDLAEHILRAVGLTLWLEDEDQMDTVTALSGSGPAYFFLMMEALQQGAERLGLPRETAALLTLQTAFGAAKMALESDAGAEALRRQVTSPGGTTERALDVLEQDDLRGILLRALEAARERSRELAGELGKD